MFGVNLWYVREFWGNCEELSRKFWAMFELMWLTWLKVNFCELYEDLKNIVSKNIQKFGEILIKNLNKSRRYLNNFLQILKDVEEL